MSIPTQQGNQFKINSIVVKYSTGGPQDYAAEFTKEGFKVEDRAYPIPGTELEG